MLEYNHILVPLDLSAHSIKTLEAAHAFATQQGAKLSIIHILDPIPVSWVVHSTCETIPDAIERVFGGEINPQDDEKQVMKHLAKLCEPFNIDEADLHLCMGDVAKEILHMAEMLKADLIVMGYHHTPSYRPFTHCTAQDVLKRAHCDVLTVGPEKVDKAKQAEPELSAVAS